ncbi:MAG: SOS response-associated peptidase [Proteobacteria bacterium]|jgi:putative SOS response-associated peptidase YedK|nr:SOS response-associated peptidase [Pseudomonadota bacterium]
MCGRFSCGSLTFQKSLLDIGVTNVSAYPFQPQFNIGPTDTHPVILKNRDRIVVQPGVWGISLSWSKNPNQKVHNAKLETVVGKLLFKKAFLNQRCLIPVDGFYEWKTEGKGKQPYWFSLENEAVFFLAGIYFVEEGKLHFVVLTQESKQPVASIHHRQPVIVESQNAHDWLTKAGNVDPASLVSANTELFARRVSRKVSQTSFNSPECLVEEKSVE